jgi:hypothetical protein
MDRGPAKLNELISRIKISQYDSSIKLDDALCGAMEVDPARISLPEKAGVVDPKNHLTGQRLQDFLNMPTHTPLEFSKNRSDPACHKVSPKNWPVLLKKLYDADMITFLPKSQVLKDGNQLVKGGLFCVPHKPESDRLINDRRPLNAREQRLGWCQLPAGPMLTQLILRRCESVRASGDDLSNYFYLIKHLDQWQPRNCFGDAIRGRQMPGLDLKPNELYYPAFKVVCMGDTNGVDLAQATHEAILREVGCLRLDQTLVYGKMFPCSNTLEGLYIDDHLAFQVLDHKKKRCRGKQGDELIMDSSRKQYDKLNLPRSAKKAFDKQYSFKAWGTAVDSETGWVSTPAEKLRQIETLTTSLLSHGEVTKKALQKLIGLYVHPFMHRRQCMAIFHHVYKYLDRLEDGQLYRIPQHIVDELVTAALLLPFSGCNIRWPVSVQISASDASSRKGGRAACLTTQSFAKVLYRFSEKRGEYTRMDWDSHAIEPPTVMEPAPSALVDSLMQHSWTATQSCSFPKKEHINLLELEMVHQEVKDRVNSGRGSCRVVNLCDSRVVVGAYAKGRSSSKHMNHRLRAHLPWRLAGNIALSNLWVSTDCNPADYPSRDKPIPQPSQITHHDTLLQSHEAKKVKIFRPISEQKFFEQEAQRLESDPVLDSIVPQATCVAEKSPDVMPQQPARVKLKFREIFAGCARLSQAVKKIAGIEVLEPVEIRKASKQWGSQDVLDEQFFEKLKVEAAAPNQLWHFGLPCGSFSILQHSNKGTRRKACPEGSNTLDREIIGNELLRRTLVLIKILDTAGNKWTLENPRSSYVWLMPNMRKCMQSSKVHGADMHQCAYGLRLKDNQGKYGPCKKHTRFVGSLPGLSSLARSCHCTQPHVHAVGGVKTKQGWKRRSELAGQYPRPLCDKYAELAAKILG